MTEIITITDPVTIANPHISKGRSAGPVTLTDRMCEKRVDQRTKYYDRKCPGLYVSINVDGVATFSFRYTDRFTGKRKSVWFGSGFRSCERISRQSNQPLAPMPRLPLSRLRGLVPSLG